VRQSYETAWFPLATGIILDRAVASENFAMGERNNLRPSPKV